MSVPPSPVPSSPSPVPPSPSRPVPSLLRPIPSSSVASSRLTAAEEGELTVRWAAGDRDAGARLVRAADPFVASVARQYRRWGVSHDDLVQQGRIGLLRAAARFDPARGCRLVTYAGTWVRGEIRSYAMASHRAVRIGATHTERVAVRRFRDGTARSAEELARVSGAPLERCRLLVSLLGQRDAALEGVLVRLVDRGPSPEEIVAEREDQVRIQSAVGRALEGLEPRARRIVEARLLADEPPSRTALGAELGLSREWVRLVERRARAELRRQLAAVAAGA